MFSARVSHVQHTGEHREKPKHGSELTDSGEHHFACQAPGELLGMQESGPRMMRKARN